jgi:hypothetical protein
MTKTAIEAFAEKFVMVLVEVATRMFANFIDRSGEEIQSAQFGVRANGTLFHR